MKILHIVLVFTIAWLLAMGVLMYLQQTIALKYWPLGVDVYPLWAGTRAVWQGASPYTEAIDAQSQQLIYGRARRDDEDAFKFYYPAYVAVVMLPFDILPARWAAITWSAAMGTALVTLILLWSWRLDPRPPPLVWGMLLLGGIFFRPALLSVINGQYGLFVLACDALAWWLILRERDGWAGVLFAFSTVKPSVALYAPIVVLIWAARWKRWRLISSFVIAMSILVVIPMLRIGWWIPDFLNQALGYSATHQGAGLGWTTQDIATMPGLLWLGSALILTGLGARQLWRDSSFPFVVAMGTLYLNLLLTPHTLEYDLALVLIPLLWLGWQWQKKLWGPGAWLVLIWLPWLSWLATITLGGSTEVWWKLIWQFYPNLLLVLTLLWLGRARIAQRLFSAVPARHSA